MNKSKSNTRNTSTNEDDSRRQQSTPWTTVPYNIGSNALQTSPSSGAHAPALSGPVGHVPPMLEDVSFVSSHYGQSGGDGMQPFSTQKEG